MAHIRRHPKSGRWQVRYLDPDGRERSKTFARKVDAENYAATVAADVLRGDYISPQAGKTTLREYAERWQSGRLHLARSTRDRDATLLASLVLPRFGRRAVASIRPSEVAEWAATLDKAPATVAKAARILFAVLELARRDSAIRSNPAADVSPPKVEPRRVGRALSDAELAKVLEAAEAVDERTAAAVHLMARCGLRIGEVLALRRSDLDLAAGVVHVRRTMSRREGARPVKGRSREDQGRTVPTPPDAADRLRRHLQEQTVASIDGHLFTAPRGGQLRYDNWRTRTWRRIVEVAGVGDVHPHDLRHTAATRLFTVDGWTPAAVQAFLGHRDPRVTLAVYTHVSSAALPAPSSLPAVALTDT